MKNILHLMSGGLDSTAMLYDLNSQGHKIHCLLYDYKQRHAQELLWAKQHCNQLHVPWTLIELPQLGGLTEQSWIVPNRNAIFISVAANFASQNGLDTITVGFNDDDREMFPDCREEFIASINHTLWIAGYSVKVEAPFLNKSKSEIAGIARSYQIKTETVWTCYVGGIKPCGKCPACKKLEAACGQ